jgi:hypothetical protein
MGFLEPPLREELMKILPEQGEGREWQNRDFARSGRFPVREGTAGIAPEAVAEAFDIDGPFF